MMVDEKHALTAIDALMDGLDAIIDGRINPLSREFALKVRDIMAERGWAIVPVEPTEAMADPRRQKARTLAEAAGIAEGIPYPNHIMLAAGYGRAEISEMRKAASAAIHGCWRAMRGGRA